MNSPSVKTVSENDCINDLLYFIDFKRKVNPVNDVVATCEAFYSPDAVLSAKKVFFDVVGEHEGIRFVSRRGDNPAKSNLEDLVNVMNKCDNDGIAMPKLLSSNFSNIPHTADGNVSLSQILFMIIGIKSQIANLEKSVVESASSSLLSAINLVPTDLSLSLSSLPAESVEISTADALPTAPPVTDNSASNASANSATDPTVGAFSSFASVMSKPAATPPITQEALQNALKSALPPAAAGNKKKDKELKRSAENRVKTNYEKNKNIIIGKKPSSGAMSWGGAPLTVDCYVGRVDFSVSGDQIKTDVVAMGIDVIEIEENQTRHRLFKSFKLVVKKTDFAQLNSPEIWPEGVVFRRFRRPRPPTAGHDASPNV